MSSTISPLLRSDLGGVFRPRSVAIYGISERTSQRIAENMTVPGVPFYGINPTKTEACGVVCSPTMADCPEVPEMVVMGVGHGRIEAAIDDVLSVPGVRAIITPGLGNEAGPVEGPRIGFRTVVSAGNETVTDVADMVAFFADDPDTRVIGLFLEAVRRPAAFEQALQRVAEAGKIAIVLKVGTSEMGARAALTHTGAMVGSDQVFSGMLRYYNAIRVDDFGHWLEHLEVFSRATPPRGRRIGAVTNSGGEGEYFADKAEQAGIPLQEFSPQLKARIVAEFPNFSGVGNPVDCWAIDDDRIVFPRVFELMAESGEFDVLVSDIDHSQWLHAGERELATNIANDLRAACHRTDLFPCVITVTTADPPIEDIEWARQHDIPLLKGSLPGLRALAARLVHRQRVPASRLLPAASPLPGAGDLPELESARIAASYGLSYVRAERCATADEAAAAAERIGYPVVVKIDNVAHKAKVGGVALGLADAAGVREAARRMGGRVIVAEQVLGGVELLIGVTRDPDFGATVSVGIGGGLAEALELITHSLAPLDAGGARELVASLPVIERLLGGDVPDHLIDAIVAVSRLAAEHPEISEIDVNPLLVSPERAVALDCLIVLDNPEERAA